MQRLCIARYMLLPSVCPSATSRCSVEKAEWIEMVLGTEAISYDLSYTLLNKFGYIQK